jgi:hypothetical protein
MSPLHIHANDIQRTGIASSCTRTKITNEPIDSHAGLVRPSKLC